MAYIRTERVILLDRNAINFIKEWKCGNCVPGLDRYIKLRRIDRYSVMVSPLLSIWEGQTGRPESQEEKLKTIQDEYNILEKFFYRSRTDSCFFKQSPNLPEILSTGLEQNFEEYSALLSKVQADLYQPFSKLQAKKYCNKLLEMADSLGIIRSHPVVISSIALMYGSYPALKVIKPKKIIEEPERHSYNALVDIMSISRISFFHALSDNENSAHPIRYELFTFDGWLQKLSTLINPLYKKSKILVEGITESTIECRRELFPMLNIEELSELADCLRIQSNVEP